MTNDSAGALDEAYAVYENSISFHINQFKASFQQLSTDLVDSDVVKWFIDLGKNGLNLLDTVVRLIDTFGGLKTVLIAVAGIEIVKHWSDLAALFTKISNLDFKWINNLRSRLDEAKMAGGGLFDQFKALIGVSSNFQLAAAGVVTVLTVLIASYQAVRQNILKARQAQIDAAKAAEQESSELIDLYSAYREAKNAYDEGTGSKEALTEATTSLLSALGVEQSKIQELTSDYTTLTGKINEMMIAALRANAETAKTGLNAATNNATDALGLGGDAKANAARFFRQGAGSEYLDIGSNYFGDGKDIDKKIQEILKRHGFEITSDDVGTLMIPLKIGNVEEAMATYESLKEVNREIQESYSTEDYANNEVAAHINQRVQELEEALTGVIDNKEIVNQTEAQLYWADAITKGLPKDVSEVKKWKQSVMQAALESGDFVGSQEEIETAMENSFEGIRKNSDEVDRLMDALENLEAQTGQTAISSDLLASNFERAAEDFDGASNSINAAIEAMKGQSTGTSISYEDFVSEGLADYSDALEYNNGALQLNAEKVRELVEARAEETIATNKSNKALEQTHYLENAAEIEKLREQLRNSKDLTKEEVAAIQESIAANLEENESIRWRCDSYDVMNASLQELTDTYHTWLNAQGASESGDMFDDAIDAVQHIFSTLNDTNSELFGRVGREDYKAAIDFVIPSDLDSYDAESINSYLDSIHEFFTFDDEGNWVGLNIERFCEAAKDEGLMVFEEATQTYKVAGEQTMEAFAEGLHLSLPMVQAMFGEMEEFGGEFTWSNDMLKTLGDLAVQADVAAEELRKLEGENFQISLDFTGDTEAEQIEKIDSTLKEMQGFKVKPGVDASEIEYANQIIAYCIAQKQELERPTILDIDTTKLSDKAAEAMTQVTELYDALSWLDRQKAIFGISSDEVKQATEDVQTLLNELKETDNNYIISLGLTVDDLSLSEAKNTLEGFTRDELQKIFKIDATGFLDYQPSEYDEQATVEYEVEDEKVQKFMDEDHDIDDAKIIYNVDRSKVNKFIRDLGDLKRTVYYNASYEKAPSSSSSKSSSSSSTPSKGSYSNNAHSNQTANAAGDWGTAPGGETLVGELGRELVVDVRHKKWYTVGDQGAEFVNIPKGSIVFNHSQTEELLTSGNITTRGLALASGTAMAMEQEKHYGRGQVSGGISKQSAHNSSVSGNSSTDNYKSPEQTYEESIADDIEESVEDLEETVDEVTTEIIDWIEIAIDRIERSINRLENVASSKFETLTTRLTATNEEMVAIAQEIATQQAAYSRYMQQAQSVGLSADLAAKVQSGAIDITEYDEETAKLIQDYQEWYLTMPLYLVTGGGILFNCWDTLRAL